MDAGSSRVSRYKSFARFAENAQKDFHDFLRNDRKGKRLEQSHKFYVCVGGAAGGVDKRAVEVFFGKVQIDRIEEWSPADSDPFRFADKVLIEKGAKLFYQRTDYGTVLCRLYPATTDDTRFREDFIVLDHMSDPARLTSRRLRGHWGALVSYMECTSVDGSPDWFDHLSAWCLRRTKPLAVNGVIEKRAICTMVERLSMFVITVGLSGFVLAIIGFVNSNNAIELHERTINRLGDHLSEARAVADRQDKEIVLLREKVALLESMQRVGAKSEITLKTR